MSLIRTPVTSKRIFLITLVGGAIALVGVGVCRYSRSNSGSPPSPTTHGATSIFGGIQAHPPDAPHFPPSAAPPRLPVQGQAAMRIQGAGHREPGSILDLTLTRLHGEAVSRFQAAPGAGFGRLGAA